jgi:hypothetical protein
MATATSAKKRPAKAKAKTKTKEDDGAADDSAENASADIPRSDGGKLTWKAGGNAGLLAFEG